jgi:nucleoid DNA-binding protein
MPKKNAKKATKHTAEKKPAKAAAKPKAIKIVKDPMSKSEIFSSIVEATELSRKQVAAVMDSFVDLIHAHLKKGSAGVFNFPGLMKLQVVRKPAVKARKGVNPFTGEEMQFKAKPARNVVKARVLKKLKDAAA